MDRPPALLRSAIAFLGSDARLRPWNFRSAAAFAEGSGSAGTFMMSTPLARAQAKLREIEQELGKYPDFQLYLMAGTRKERARMERLLMGIPAFALWRKLRDSITLTIASPL